ncbi:hypothetical protein [Micromonospora sp. NBC_01813]|uniref:hypothetical protein n=1 Tax=Micromonospora sp. NBC_01813 TaxID=2975988 RepID=UPI002DDB3588|nr:hypothetical protein [Micromonospora sp. NBC_01813]WSA06268.1 hypothetical protein OG958_18245 [Micromonospora sp. NBC_01813]
MNEDRNVSGPILPLYFDYFGAPGKMVETPDGGMTAWRLSRTTGGWEPAVGLIDEILRSTHPEISSLSQDRFVQRTEAVRGFYLSGDGPAFALYALINDIRETAEEDRRRITDYERDVIRGLRRKTYVMFETELQRRGDPAADPSLAAVGQP